MVSSVSSSELATLEEVNIFNFDHMREKKEIHVWVNCFNA